VYATRVQDADWGERIGSLFIIRDKAAIRKDYSYASLPAKIGVDSGQVGIFDDVIFPHSKEEQGEYGDVEGFYGGCCAITEYPNLLGIMPNRKGVVTNSEIGDGCYPLFAHHETDVINSPFIDFGEI
jgi:hypothetical protein